MTARVVNILMLVLLLASPAVAQPSGCPYDADGDGRVDIDDLYHLTQNPADINGDGIADSDDTRCLEAYLRCIERLDMSFRPGDPAADGNVPSLSYRESGTSQVMRVVREPSPDGLGCISQAWTTTLLGTRAGLTGPVEIRLDRDGFMWQSLFADASATSPGSTDRRGMLTCDGSGVEFVASSPAITVASSSETRALVLLHGQNITDAAVAKGVEDAAARSIGGGLIDAYTDVDGNVTLPTRGVLVLFELDAGDQSSPSFAFDDAVLLVDAECGDVSDDSPQVFVLRDSIGPDFHMTEGQTIGRNTSDLSGILPSDNFPLFELTPTEQVRVISVEMVMRADFGFSLDWSYAEFELRSWSSFAAVNHNPSAGDLSSFSIAVSSPPQLVPGTSLDNRVAIFSIPGNALAVDVGDSLIFAIVQTNPLFPDEAQIVESIHDVPPDNYVGGGLVFLDGTVPGSGTGVYGVRFIAETLP